ncbi:fumarate reductase subunit C [Rhodococcus olei]|uniref:Fumarate reductase subunit C n=1 Tax=Rhodococcus olei TaxID=2161675 RepID=A0ABP8PJW0_9NOCA
MSAPALYRQPVPRLWWLRRRSYLLFALREVSCVFVAWFVVFLLMLVAAVSGGADRYQRFLDFAANPWTVALNLIALAFVLLHTVTWFALAPRAMVVRVGGHRVSPRAVLGVHYAVWVLVTVGIGWLVLR